MLELSIPLTDNVTINDCIRFTFQDENLDSLWYDETTQTEKPLIKNRYD